MVAKKNNAGFGMVEAIVAISIAAIFIVLLSAVNTFYMKVASAQNNQIQGAFLAEEGLEAIRFERDEGWDANIEVLANDTDYYATFNGTVWQISTTPSTVGIFTRKIRLGAVYRDANDNIVQTLETLDPETRLVTSTVTWAERGEVKSKVVSTYITNLFDN